MSFTIACIQSEALDCSLWRESLQKGLAAVEEAARSGAKLVLLPEAFFPGYYLSGMMEGEQEWRSLDVTALFSGKARELKIHLAAGMVLFAEDEAVNAGILWGPDGKELLRTVKSNLWHFDEKYVRPGYSFPVADTSFGRIGMMICADGRIPEIARILALKKASLILDLTNLTSSGRDRKALSNPQLDYMLPVRAAENGVWIAVADKVGLEASTVLNCGGSRVIDPRGGTVAAASSWREEILFAEIDLETKGFPLPQRRPEEWSLLGQGTGETEAQKNQFKPLHPVENELFASLIRFSSSCADEYAARAASFLLRALDQGNRLICLPSVPRAEEDRMLKALLPLMPSEDEIAVLPLRDGGGRGEFLLFSSTGVVGRTGGHAPEVLSTPLGRIGGVFGRDGWNPEPIRCLMIAGAEIVLWYGEKMENIPGELLEKFVRTRASENRLFILASFEEGGPVLMAGPSGAILAAALQEGDQGISAMVHRMESRCKTVVPGTNIIGGRHPEAYGDLFSSPRDNKPLP